MVLLLGEFIYVLLRIFLFISRVISLLLEDIKSRVFIILFFFLNINKASVLFQNARFQLNVSLAFLQINRYHHVF